MKKVNSEVDSSPRSDGIKKLWVCFSFHRGLFFVLDILKKVNSEVDSSPRSDGIKNLWDVDVVGSVLFPELF